VLSEALYKGRKINLISKSGGFGQESLFTDLSKILIRESEKATADQG
jgi:uncharacterized protein YgbK (DUF1537 family)